MELLFPLLFIFILSFEDEPKPDTRYYEIQSKTIPAPGSKRYWTNTLGRYEWEE